MITRLWRGWTGVEDADAYERFLLTDLFPAMRKIPGFRGADILRRNENGEVGFVTLTRFTSFSGQFSRRLRTSRGLADPLWLG